ncbi:recombinase family protein [Gordonia bronchialis]|nr:recombinase family protein [Gordonia bronchialis]MCC3323477.1 recombinase family protein [Gordonia bronchialis]
MSKRRTAPANTVVSYVRVSTAEQADSGAGLDAQRAAIAAEAARRGWTLVAEYADEGVSGGKAADKRPGLAAALAAVESGQAAALVVAKSDRLARNLRALLDVIDRVESAAGAVVAVDGTVDTSTAAGRFTTQIMGGVAELERSMISDRTKAALAARKAQGVRLGRPSETPAEVTARIVAAKAEGKSLRAIAAELTAAGIPTVRGGATWHASTVRAVLTSQDAAALA